MHDQLSYMYLQSKCLLSSNNIKLFYIHLFFLNVCGYNAESTAGQPGTLYQVFSDGGLMFSIKLVDHVCVSSTANNLKD